MNVLVNTFLYEGGRPDNLESVGITHVTVKDGVTSIPPSAFVDWKDLVSVHVPSSVTSIGEYAFLGCSSLLSINLPESSLQTIGPWAFANCIHLSKITLPHSLTDIGNGAFNKCSSLSSITIPPSITRIGDLTFSRCSSLYQVTIPPPVTSIGGYAFSHCDKLKSILLPNALQSIGQFAFHNCTLLESIHIPTSVASIGYATFKNCTSLKVIYSPSSALEINNDIFKDCNINNLIILTDNHFNYQGMIPSITLQNIQQCIHHLPTNDIDTRIPPNQQLHTLHHAFQQEFPQIAQRAQQSSLNLLHLLVYFPVDDNDIYEPLLLTLLTNYPQTMTAVDTSGRTPLHHVMTCTKQIMNRRCNNNNNNQSNCYKLLIDHCPDTVVHIAIQSVLQSLWPWEGVRDTIVYEMPYALGVGNVESGLLPFMTVAAVVEGFSKDLIQLSIVYELLCLNPGVLKEYN